MFYLVKTPAIIKKLYPQCIWNFSREEKVMYLTFDDGPHPDITPFVLDTLKTYDAKGTFFCIGKNVKAHPDVYRRIINDGNAVGNHTHNHLNGSKVSNQEYVDDITEARKYIDARLFRPPYGKISRFQANLLKPVFRIIMWDVLSADFDETVSAAKSASNVLKNAREGSVVVFHDSEKAFRRLEKALPDTLDHFSAQGFRFEAIRS